MKTDLGFNGSRSKTETVLIVDGHGLAFRAFYALPPMNAPDGTPTNAVLGFMNMLLKVEDDVGPCCCAVVFDAPTPSFRHTVFPEYKAGRKPTPEEFRPQVPLLKELLTAMGYPVIMEPGVEADDIIASLAAAAVRSGREAVIISSDKDLMQVLAPGIKMLRPIRGISTLKDYDAVSFEGEYGFPPSSMPDYLALLGDTADNVPGVPGIGEKTALQLIGETRTLERLFEALGDQKPAVRKKLEAGRETAFFSRDLIRLKFDLPLDPASMKKSAPQQDAAVSLCLRLGMNKFAEKINRITTEAGLPVPDPAVFSAGEENRGEKNVNFDEILDADELMVVFLHSGKYPPLAAEAELQFADRDGRYAVLRADEFVSSPSSRFDWKKLKGKKLYVSDYKELAACFGPDAFSECGIWDLKTAHYLLHPDKMSHTLEDIYPGFRERGKLPALLMWNAERELNLEIRRHEKLYDLMENVDIPLIPVLVHMERGGIRLDDKIFANLQKELEQRVAAIEEEIADAAGEDINLNSPKQVAWLLFERLGLPAGTKTKGKTGYSTSASVLENLAALGLPHSGVPQKMLEHRELTKMLNGFVVPLQKAARAGDGVVHTTFEAALTGTGRLSSRDPNLQNLPAFGNWSARLKEGLVPLKKGNVFVAADYSQIELRLLAHLSGEERLQEAFRNGRDIHRETASWVFSTPQEAVTPELRRVAKMINFGLLYGMSSFGLADRLGIPRGDAGAIITRYFAALPGVKNYLEGSAELAQKRGYTETLFGRIRPLAEATEGIRDRGGVKRVAVNTPLQGSAADIARKAMVSFHNAFAGDGEVRLFLQVHDSLICECPEERAVGVGEALREIMSSAATLSVPLEVEVKIGRSL